MRGLVDQGRMLKQALWVTALTIFMVGSTPVHAKGGGGISVAGAGGGSSSNPYGYVGIGGEGVLYPVPMLRVGAEGYGLLSPVGSGAKAGVFGDLVIARIANADLFLGSALGLGGGNVLGGAALYVRPEFGALWNLGRTALEAKLNFMLATPFSEGQEPSRFLGLNVGLLFGDFPIGSVRAHERAPRGRRAPPPRRNPPPPPPPRR